MSATTRIVLAYLDRKGKSSYPQPWWPLSKRLGSCPSQDPRGFCDLDVELVLEIISYIKSDLDRLSLALTCKSLLELTKCWPIPTEIKESTRMLTIGYCFISDRIEKRCTARWDLLGRLENERWRRCMGCFKLHPVDEFHTLDLCTPAYRRTCIFGKLVGIVRVCGCVQMTFRDKVKITKELIRQHNEQQSESENEADCNRRLLPGFGPVTGQHECSYQRSRYIDRDARVQCKLKFSLDEDHNLILETEYNIREMNTGGTNANMITALLCPHQRIVQSLDTVQIYVRDYWYPYRWRFVRREITKRWNCLLDLFSCPWCKTTVFDVQKVGLDINQSLLPHFAFKTRRNLGNAIDNADDTWYRQTETFIEDQPSVFYKFWICVIDNPFDRDSE